MKTEIRSNSALELQKAVSECERLTSQPSMTKQEERRYSFLLSQISLLKSGFTPQEIAKVEAERLARDAGVVDISVIRGDDQAEREIRDLMRGRSRFCPSTLSSFEVDIQKLAEARAAAAGSQTITYSAASSGGAFVPFGFHDSQIDAMKQYDEIFDDENCQVIESVTGNPMGVPATDDTAAASVQVGENTDPGAGTDFVAYNVQLQSYSFRSGRVIVSRELLQDSGISISGLLNRAFSRRHAKGVGAKLITGSGVNEPKGLVTAAQAVMAANVTAAGSSANDGSDNTGANSVGTDDIALVYRTLNAAYRRNAIWAMNDATALFLSELKDKYGRPVIDLQAPRPVLMGKRVIICPSMASIAPSASTIVFYDPAYFVQRRVKAGSFIRMYQEAPSLAENNAVAFESWYRTDSNLVVASQTYPPCVVLNQHSQVPEVLRKTTST
jgi:HK97 family phage major capsid protein